MSFALFLCLFSVKYGSKDSYIYMHSLKLDTAGRTLVLIILNSVKKKMYNYRA